MNGENPLPLWARHALIGVGLFLAGALLAFGYSYRPLHGALSWQVDRLESRLDERNRENVQLSDALAKQKTFEATRIDPATLAQVERELEQTKRVLNQAERDLKRTERKRRESVANATKWRKRFEESRDAAMPIAATMSSPIANRETLALPPSTPPAAPAAPASPPTESSLSASADASSDASSDASQPSTERGMLSPSEPAGPAIR